ncbi:hypothetical protein L345_18124, partial [Ophiophagus hannah]
MEGRMEERKGGREGEGVGGRKEGSEEGNGAGGRKLRGRKEGNGEGRRKGGREEEKGEGGNDGEGGREERNREGGWKWRKGERDVGGGREESRNGSKIRMFSLWLPRTNQELKWPTLCVCVCVCLLLLGVGSFAGCLQLRAQPDGAEEGEGHSPADTAEGQQANVETLSKVDQHWVFLPFGFHKPLTRLLKAPHAYRYEDHGGYSCKEEKHPPPPFFGPSGPQGSLLSKAVRQ